MKKFFLITAMFVTGTAATYAADATEPTEPTTSSEPAHLTESPYVGSTLKNGESYYLYNVKTGTWIDANDQIPYQWDSTAALNKIGMDFSVNIDNELLCFYSNIGVNGSLSGADADALTEFSLNSGLFEKWRVKYTASMIDGKEVITYTIYVNKEEANTSHSYNLSAKWDEDLKCYRLHRDNIPEDGDASTTADTDTDAATGLDQWQFVTREERLEVMKAAAATQPDGVDATWLIPNHNMITFNNRDTKLWKGKTGWPGFVSWQNLNETVGVDENNDGIYDNDSRALVSREIWQGTIDRYIVIEGLPEGTYSYSVSAFYRDGDPWREDNPGPSEPPFTNRAWYYAGCTGRQVMNVMDDSEKELNKKAGYTGQIGDNFFPTYGAGVAFTDGRYCNDPIATYVSEKGRLVLGLWKSELFTADSFNFKQMHLTYKAGNEADETADKDALDKMLTVRIAEAGKYQGAMAAKEEAETALASGTGSDKMAALRRVADAINLYIKTEDIFQRTKNLCPTGTDVSKAEKLYNEAQSEDEVILAIQTLRGIRRRAMNVRTIPDTFKGASTMEEGKKYFIYNVGQELFFDGGAEWGVHPMLDNPGAEFTPEALEATSAGGFKCKLSTNFVGENKETDHYLSSWGSLDGDFQDTWEFVPVEGEQNVFTIRLAATQSSTTKAVVGNYIVYIEHAPSVNLQGTPENPQWCERTVEYQKKEKDVDLTSPDSWWKIVPVESRKAFETASTDTPFDISYMIANPGFNRILNMSYPDAWTTTGADFSMSKWVNGTGNAQWNWNLSETAEASNLIPSQFEISQTLENMPDGVYMFECSGYYRDGAFSEEKPIQFFCEATPAVDSKAAAGDNAAAAIAEGDNAPADTDNKAAVNLCNVLDFADYAPGEGTAVIKGDKTIEVPGDFLQSAAYYRSGLYKNYLVVNVNSGTAGKRSDIKIGVKHSDPTASQAAGSYINLDDFRGTYYGPDATVKDANDSIITGIDNITDDADNAPADNRIFNLQGIEVANPTAPGIYIRNGRKFVVR